MSEHSIIESLASRYFIHINKEKDGFGQSKEKQATLNNQENLRWKINKINKNNFLKRRDFITICKPTLIPEEHFQSLVCIQKFLRGFNLEVCFSCKKWEYHEKTI